MPIHPSLKLQSDQEKLYVSITSVLPSRQRVEDLLSKKEYQSVGTDRNIGHIDEIGLVIKFLWTKPLHIQALRKIAKHLVRSLCSSEHFKCS